MELRPLPSESRTLLLQLASQPESYRVDWDRPDPLLIAKGSPDDRVGLIAALFAYGNVKAILKFLQRFNWHHCLEGGEGPKNLYYRFQTPEDVAQFCETLRRLGPEGLRELFWEGYRREESPIDGIRAILTELYRLNPYRSPGYQFLLGQIPPVGRRKGVSPYKRWNMFLRWMVRTSPPDLGRWREIPPARLILPLDTHTHRVGLQLGLLHRKSYDLESAVQLTEALRQLDPEDPLRFEFILYRIGQRYLDSKSTPTPAPGS